MEIRRRVAGPEHPDTLLAESNLAAVYGHEGSYGRAQALEEQVLEMQRRAVLGPDHPDTLRTMVSLALVYDHQGKYAQAEALNSQILEIRRRLLGPEHQDTLMSMNNLATNYAEEGKYAQAVTTFREVLEVQRRVLVPTHPDTLISMNNIAEAECSDPDLRQHCSGEALQLARAAVEGLPNEGGAYQTLGMAVIAMIVGLRRLQRSTALLNWIKGPTPPISSSGHGPLETRRKRRGWASLSAGRCLGE